jgi:hypothetical protein
MPIQQSQGNTELKQRGEQSLNGEPDRRVLAESLASSHNEATDARPNSHGESKRRTAAKALPVSLGTRAHSAFRTRQVTG